MSVIKGDFLGFTFDGVHSTELGIFRVSDGDRYSENLLPVIQDKTVQIPGADGTYYYGSFYTQRQFNISIAYEDLTEAQLRRLKTIFSDKKIHSLIFDELPYKVYKVKVNGTPNLKYVCFERPAQSDLRDREIDMGIKDKNTLYGVGARTTSGRVYKGEGQLSFISYNPFARSRFKYLDQYVIQNIPEWGSMDTASASDVYYNLYDWVDSSRMLHSGSQKASPLNGEVCKIDEVNRTGVMYHNAGDIYTPFSISFQFSGRFPGLTMGENRDYMQLMMDRYAVNGNKVDSYILTQNNLRNAKILSIENSELWIAAWGIFANTREEAETEAYTGYIGDRLEELVNEGASPYINEEIWINSNKKSGTIRIAPTYMKIKPFELKKGDTGIRINGKLHLIEGINSVGRPTGNIYNKYVSEGDFFELEPTEGLTWLPLYFEPGLEENFSGSIDYTYLYF